MQYISNSPQETEAIGFALGQILIPGSIVAYRGDLGAGKTAFTRGLARGLGYADAVTRRCPLTYLVRLRMEL